MANYRTRRFIPVALVIVVAIIAVVGLVYLARIMFFSGGSILVPSDTSREALVSTTVDRSVRMKVRGPILADEDFRSYQIRISPNQRALTLYEGYENDQINDTVLYNNIPAYIQFVNALDRARMMNGTELGGEMNNTAGVCASGLLYEFQILNKNDVQKSLWASTCNTPRGSLRGNVNILSGLFIKQIPDAQKKINDLWQ